MEYLDANVFIYSVVSKSDRLALLSKNILVRIAEGKLDAATSVLTWDEFAWVARKSIGPDLAEIEGGKFLNIPNLRFLAVDESVVRMSQKIVEKYKLKPRDAIHAATMLSHGIKEIISNDPDFDAVRDINRIPVEKFK